MEREIPDYVKAKLHQEAIPAQWQIDKGWIRCPSCTYLTLDTEGNCHYIACNQAEPPP
jgi:hypothetical protein